MSIKNNDTESRDFSEAPFWTRLKESLRFFVLLATMALIIFMVLHFNLYGFPMLLTVLCCIGAGVLVNAAGVRLCRFMEAKTGEPSEAGPADAQDTAEQDPLPENDGSEAGKAVAGDDGGMRAQLRDLEASYLRSFGLEPGSGDAGKMFPEGWHDGAGITHMRALLEAIDKHIPLAETEVWVRELSKDAR